MCKVDHFIVGTAGGSAIRKHSIWNPSTGEVRAEVALGDAALLDRAVAAAKKVQPKWAVTNPLRRARTMFAFKQLVEANRDELAHFLSSVHGKVIDDAQGNIPRGLEVTDDGPGIPQDILPEAFEAFVTTKREGLGIGLSIARTIVEAHGGKISASNFPGAGAAICFTLPLSPFDGPFIGASESS